MIKADKKATVSALIIAKNEEGMIDKCLQTLRWCNEIIVLDDGSVDETASIAEEMGAKVISFKHQSFARKREELLKRAKSDWVIYIDADERVIPTLAKEIMVHIETGTASAITFRRNNMYYGQPLKYGGWGHDYVTRVFKREALQGWFGEIHESPKFEGNAVEVKTPLIHLTHRDTASGLKKSAEWTPMEAEALVKSGIPDVTFWTLVRKGSMEFIRRAILKKGYKEGMVGMVESLIQAMNRTLVYIQVWERQQKPPIQEKYQKIEQDISKLWQEKTS